MSAEPPRGRLLVELVPKTAWGSNLRTRIPRRRWDELRRAQAAAAGNRCEICGDPRWALECHEVWEYLEEQRVQRLVRLICLCPFCHQVKHFGRTVSEGKGPRAMAHLMSVNGWTREQADAHVSAAFSLWGERSRHPWDLDLSAIGVLGDSPAG